MATAMEEDEPVMPGLQLDAAPGKLLLPGDSVAKIVDLPPGLSSLKQEEDMGKKGSSSRTIIRISNGLTQNKEEIKSSKCGILQTDAKRNKLQLFYNQHRYIPNLEDMVIGIVQEKHSDEYRLDLNGIDTAILSSLSFEGASKKNKPNLQVGSIVYCRVIRSSKFIETEVSCIEPGSSKSWTGGETLYGELKNGNVVKVSLALARYLMKRNEKVLKHIGNKVAFQSAVGLNGRVWIQAADIKNTVAISQAIKRADDMIYDDWLKFMSKLFNK